jgi:hypothetical protein
MAGKEVKRTSSTKHEASLQIGAKGAKVFAETLSGTSMIKVPEGF